MSPASAPIGEDELHAFVDDRLSADRRAAVAAYLERNPGEAAQVAQYAEQKRQLRAYLQPKFDEPPPERFQLDRIRAEMRRRQTRRFANVAAVLAVGIFCGVAGWIAYPYTSGKSDALVAEAIEVRNGDLHSDPIPADAIATGEERDRFADKIFAAPVKIPDLEKAGYVFTGMTTYSEKTGVPAVEVSYRDGQGRVFTLYMHRSLGADRFDLSHRGAMQICVWQNETLSVVMLGEMSSKEMLKVATLTYADLDF